MAHAYVALDAEKPHAAALDAAAPAERLREALLRFADAAGGRPGT